MMENCEDIRLAHVTTKDMCSISDINIEGNNEFCEYKRQAQNFNFGAEILSTNVKPTLLSTTTTTTETNNEEATSEQQLKTNDEVNIKTLFTNTHDDKNDLLLQEFKTSKSVNENENENDFKDEEESSLNIDANKIDLTDQSDESTTDTDCSEMSGLSDMSGQDWKPVNLDHLKWVQRQKNSGRDPRDILSLILPNSQDLGQNTNDTMLWNMLSSMLSSCNDNEPRRVKLNNINTFEDVLHLVQNSQKIIVLTGAGVSVSCGIPDFRSSNGIYSRLARDFPDLPDPQAMFDINYFSRDPRPFYKFAREIYPGQFQPSPGHRFIKMLETKGKLLRNYTQNIDTLEQVAGIKNVIECHGSFSTASCTKCKYKCTADDIRDDIFAQRIPVCPLCQPTQSVAANVAVAEIELRALVENGIMKPDIVFFGEGLPEQFHTVMATDKDECDLLIVMGSSLKVRPVNYIPSSIRATVPQILINREQLPHLDFDVELLGDSDVIINQLCHILGNDWKDICFDNTVLTETNELLVLDDEQQSQLDTDTQSLKSNSSGDYVLSSAGTYSDSGFESSTFTSVNRRKSCPSNDTENDKCTRPAASTSATEAASPCAAASTINNLNPNANHRHLSVDSSKDSGIEQCESPKPATIPKTSDDKDLHEICSDRDLVSKATLTENTCIKLGMEGSSSSASTSNNIVNDMYQPTTSNKTDTTVIAETRSAGERLKPGTYYCLGNNRSYIFPGAQVFLDDLIYGEDNYSSNNECDILFSGIEDDVEAETTLLAHEAQTSVIDLTVNSPASQSPAKKRQASSPFDDIIPNSVSTAGAEDASNAINDASAATNCANEFNKSFVDLSTSTQIQNIDSLNITPPPNKKQRSSLESICSTQNINKIDSNENNST